MKGMTRVLPRPACGERVGVRGSRIAVILAVLCAASAYASTPTETHFHESALLSSVVRYAQAHPAATPADIARKADELLPREGLNFKAALDDWKTDVEATLHKDAALKRKLGKYRLEPLSAQASTTSCGTAYYLPFTNNPAEIAGISLADRTAYLKTRGAFRFDSVALLERGRARPVRRWPLPDESEVPAGISKDGRTLFLEYKLASAETGWTPIKAGGEDHMLLAIGPESLIFADNYAELSKQSWDTLEELPWKVPAPEGDYESFGVLKAWGKEFYFGFEPICR